MKKSTPPPRKPEEQSSAVAEGYQLMIGPMRAQAAFSVFESSGNGVLFWRSYQEARRCGLPPMETWLAELDVVVANLLAAESPEAVRAAVMLERPQRGGPGQAATADDNLGNSAIGVSLFMAHLKLGGQLPDDGWPPRLAPGTLAAVQRDYPEMTKAALKMAWQRHKRTADRPPADALAALQWPPPTRQR